MKKTETTTTINGVPLTERMLGTLSCWKLGTNDNDAKYFIEKLSNLQDFFCNQFKLFSEDEMELLKENAAYLDSIILIKNALKPFAEYVAKDSEE